MANQFRLAGAALLFAIAGAAPQAQAIPISLGSYAPAFTGIDLATDTLNGGSSVAYVARIDLTAPGIGFTTTPPSGPLNTTAATTSQFLRASGAQLAVNANFFAPCCTAAPEPKTVLGLAVSQGTLVAPATTYPSAGAVELLLSRTNQASVQTVTAGGQSDLSNVFNAVAGSGEIVTNGANTASTNPPGVGDPSGINPRTDAGVSQDGRYLYLAAIDGRQPGYSIGITDSDAANLLLAVGAYNGLNLDGGGSTSLVVANGTSGARVVNRPSGGAERYDGNALGVFALPLAVPEPASLTMVIGGLALVAVRRRR